MDPSPDLAEFIEVVAGDPNLQRTLKDEQSNDAFAQACAALAEEHRLRVTADEVLALLHARNLVWLQRNIL